MEDDGKPLPFGRKRVVPLTAAEEQEALALRLPESLPFKLHQAAGRIHRPGQREKRLKHFIAQEEYHTLPASEPTCAHAVTGEGVTWSVGGLP